MTLRDRIQKLKPTFAGKLLYHAIPYRRQVVLDNIKIAFGTELNDEERLHLAKAFYSHLATSLWEGLAIRFLPKKNLKLKAKVIGQEKAMKAAEKGKGVLILTGHLGNWEFAPIAGISQFDEFKGRFHFVRKSIRNKTIEKILFRRFHNAGLHVIPKHNSINQICDALADGDAVVMIMDQNAQVENKHGILVEFFGKKAGTLRSLASLARYSDAPVVPAMSYRENDGTHVLEFFDPIEYQTADNSQQETYINTLNYNKVLEKMVLSHPEQWLWLHKRWKYQ